MKTVNNPLHTPHDGMPVFVCLIIETRMVAEVPMISHDIPPHHAHSGAQVFRWILLRTSAAIEFATI